MSHKCKECGWEHPIISGACPAAKAKEMEGTVKGKAILNFTKILTDFLQKSDSWEEQIKLVKNILKIG